MFMSRAITTVFSSLPVHRRQFVCVNKPQSVEERENRWLTEMAMRHTRHDPFGSHTKVNFIKEDHCNHMCVKGDAQCCRIFSEEDVYYTKMAKKFARKN